MANIMKSRIEELETYFDIAPLFNLGRIEEIVELYEQRKITHYKTALNVIKLLASKDKRIIDSEKSN